MFQWEDMRRTWIFLPHTAHWEMAPAFKPLLKASRLKTHTALGFDGHCIFGSFLAGFIFHFKMIAEK